MTVLQGVRLAAPKLSLARSFGLAPVPPELEKEPAGDQHQFEKEDLNQPVGDGLGQVLYGERGDDEQKGIHAFQRRAAELRQTVLSLHTPGRSHLTPAFSCESIQ